MIMSHLSPATMARRDGTRPTAESESTSGVTRLQSAGLGLPPAALPGGGGLAGGGYNRDWAGQVGTPPTSERLDRRVTAHTGQPMTNGSRGQVGTDLATRVRPRVGAHGWAWTSRLFHVEQWPPGRGLGMGTRWGTAGVRWCSGWVSDDNDPYHHPTATPRFSREMRNVIRVAI